MIAEISGEKAKKPEKIMNMEEIKRAFFNSEYDEFDKLLKESELIVLEGNYKYCEDYNEKPLFVANNFAKGVSHRLNKESNYLMCCFRCYKNGDGYNFPSMWIINTREYKDFFGENKNYFGDIIDDFDLDNIIDMEDFMKKIRKVDEDSDENFVSEYYVH
jgi:hypothetical protein